MDMGEFDRIYKKLVKFQFRGKNKVEIEKKKDLLPAKLMNTKNVTNTVSKLLR